jgi:HAD superfamily hydrolase (TIGR01509 family)
LQTERLMTGMIQALIFDFDGLILDTEISAYQSWQEIYQEYSCELPLEKWVLCIGGTLEHFDVYAYLADLLGHEVSRDDLTAKYRKHHLDALESQLALPGVEACMRDAKQLGLKIGLASNSPYSWVSGHLNRLGLISYFDCIKTGDDVTHAKPHPELYLAALDCLGVQPEQALALEDSPHGVRAAQRAGIFCIAIPNQLTYHLPLDHADFRITSLEATPLTHLIAEFEAHNMQKERSLSWD